MQLDLARLLGELRQGLEDLYGQGLRGLYLFGSYARNAAEPESDVDVLIVLERVERYGAEIDRTGALISGLSLRYGVSLSRVFVGEDTWRGGDSPFLRSVRPEAIPA